jgi:isopenicillin N synthase-like dioxygenase
VAGGLQVQDIGNDEGAEQGKWTDVPFVDGGYVVNLGQVLSIMMFTTILSGYDMHKLEEVPRSWGGLLVEQSMH